MIRKAKRCGVLAIAGTAAALGTMAGSLALTPNPAISPRPGPSAVIGPAAPRATVEVRDVEPADVVLYDLGVARIGGGR